MIAICERLNLCQFPEKATDLPMDQLKRKRGRPANTTTALEH